MDKVVLIAGVSGGIGRATALEFVRRGARVVLGGRNDEAGHKLVAELGDRSLFRKVDVTIEADSRALVALAVERFGRLDVAVNNAALEARGKIDAFDEATYTRVFDTNVKGVFFAMKAQVEAMRRTGGGSIVNLSSTGGSRGMAGHVDLCREQTRSRGALQGRRARSRERQHSRERRRARADAHSYARPRDRRSPREARAARAARSRGVPRGAGPSHRVDSVGRGFIRERRGLAGQRRHLGGIARGTHE
jgi:NAD(P)-dependent dehydrogenase (short-subunit alcohol dehydrogenase family)